MSRARRSAASGATLAAKAVEVHQRLCAEYHCPIDYFHHLDPLSELVSSLLSHRTKNRDSGAAFKALRDHFGTWETVRDAPVDQVQAAIHNVTWPEQKAPRIQAVLREVTNRVGSLTLDFLRDLSPEQGRAWLEQIEGVGPKTSAAVLSFSTLRMPALPVDSHHHRVATRLGLVPASASLAAAHEFLQAQLPKEWDAQAVYDNHQVMMRHGKLCCFYQAPACERCPLLDLCPTGRARMGVTEEAPREATLFDWVERNDEAKRDPDRASEPRRKETGTQ